MFSICIQISPKFVHKGPNDNKPALVQIMASHRAGDKPLSEPMMALVHRRIYASLGFDDVIMTFFKNLVYSGL